MSLPTVLDAVHPPFVPAASGRYQALVLEDDKALCFLVTKFLRKAGWTVILAGSIAEATRFVSENLTIAIVDINLPDGDGIEFLKTLTETAPKAKPIILSAANDIHIGVEAMKAGAFEFLSKPLKPKQLVSAARRALEATHEEERAASA